MRKIILFSCLFLGCSTTELVKKGMVEGGMEGARAQVVYTKFYTKCVAIDTVGSYYEFKCK